LRIFRSAAGERHAALAVPADQLLILQAGEEGIQIDLLRDVALLLQVAHPVHRLVDVAARGEHELVEQAQEVEPGEDRLDQGGV